MDDLVEIRLFLGPRGGQRYRLRFADGTEIVATEREWLAPRAMKKKMFVARGRVPRNIRTSEDLMRLYEGKFK